MKKDLQNNKVSLWSLLFLFFFSFAVTEVNAQTEDVMRPDVVTYNGTKYNVAGHLSGFTFMTESAAATAFLNEAQSMQTLSGNTPDDGLQIEAQMKSEYYKHLYKDVISGTSVTDALKGSVFLIQSLTTKHYSNYDASVSRPNPVQVFTDAVQLVAL